MDVQAKLENLTSKWWFYLVILYVGLGDTGPIFGRDSKLH